jgi:hypothetical protein
MLIVANATITIAIDVIKVVIERFINVPAKKFDINTLLSLGKACRERDLYGPLEIAFRFTRGKTTPEIKRSMPAEEN